MEKLYRTCCRDSELCNCLVDPSHPTKTIAEMQAEVDKFCQEKGWRDKPVSFGEAMALLHSEVSEALEAYRNDKWLRNTDDMDSVEMEFADIFIRLLDDCQIFGVDLVQAYEKKMSYNRQRSYRHGNKNL